MRAAILDKKLMEAVAKKYRKPVNQIFNDPRKMHLQKTLEDRANEKLLFEVLKRLPDWGVGRLLLHKLNISNFNDEPTYWKITRVLVDHDDQSMNYGIAWGIFTWKGWCEEYEKEIPNAHWHGWRLIPKMDEHYFVNYTPKSKPTHEVPLYVRAPPLLSMMWKADEIEKKSKNVEKEPMVRCLVERDRHQTARQKLPDGTMV